MMTRLCMIGLAAMLAAPAAFGKDMPKGSIAGYLTMSELDVGTANDDGTGFGVRGWATISEPFFVHGEYQTTSLDNFGTDLESLRIGGGLAGDMGNGLMWLGKAEMIDFGSDADQGGFGIHGGVMGGSGQVGFFGTLGYLSTDDTDGLEFDVGATFAFTREFSGVVDYRSYMGSVDPAGDFEVTDLRLGVAYNFY